MFGSAWQPATIPSPQPTQRCQGGPLAPALYQALCKVFGAVKIRKAGELAEIRTVVGLDGPTSRLESPGELYNFRCPWCHDQRSRGWISHMYGQPDPATGRPMRGLVNCWNEDCFDVPGRRHDFEMLLLGALPLGAIVPIDTTRGEHKVNGPARMPGMMIKLSDMDQRHHAVRYVVSRGFDPSHLSQRYGVGYCADADPAFPEALDRIVIPIFQDYLLIGWQARRVDGRDKFMKYYTMPGLQTGQHIYNWDRVSQCDTVVLVEGVMDAWAVGDQAGALFGNTLKDGQLQLLHSLRDKQPVVVLLFDKGASDAVAKVSQQLLAAFPDRVVVVSFPESVTRSDCRVWPVNKIDPGVLHQGTLATLIQAAIRQQIAG